MALMDEFKKEREAIKHKSLIHRLSYFWQYHKWQVGLVILAIVFLATYVYPVLTKPETLINGVLLNTYDTGVQNPATKLASDFMKDQGYDDTTNNVVLNGSLLYSPTGLSNVSSSNYQIMQVLLTQSSTGDLNFITGDLESMLELAYKDFYSDLSVLLTDEQFTRYEPYMLYIDYEVLTSIKEANSKQQSTEHILFPDCRKPENMTNPVPVMIDMTQSNRLQEIYQASHNTICFGAVYTEHQEELLKFIDYLMQ